MTNKNNNDDECLNSIGLCDNKLKNNNEIKHKKTNRINNIEDFMVLGRYTTIVCLFSELMLLCQLNSTIYMIFAGK